MASGIPTLIQEQNSYAGVTNKLLAQKANAICVAYEGMERFFPADKILVTGNPVRQNILNCTLTPQQARQKFGLDPDRRTILVVGGSLGARTVNNCIAAALDTIKADSEVQLIWQTGKIYDEQVAPQCRRNNPATWCSRLSCRIWTRHTAPPTL